MTPFAFYCQQKVYVKWGLLHFTKDDCAIGKTIARFDDIVARIERQDYQIAIRPAKLCLSCDMRAYCDNKNWKFRKND